MIKLTREQSKILDFIIRQQGESGIIPTIREIAAHFGYCSTNNVRQHLRLIERKGYIRRVTGRARSIEVLVKSDVKRDARSQEVPIVGSIAAGAPIMAVENIEGSIVLDRGLFKGDDLFSLRVKGESMKNAGILDGDIAIIHKQASVNNGEIAAVIIENDATLKRFERRHDKVVLKAENPEFSDIVLNSDREVLIAGKLMGVMRKC